VAELGARPDLASAQCATAVLRCCDLLLRHWGAAALGGGGGGAAADARGAPAARLLARVAPHFPVHAPSVAVAAPVRDQLVRLNVAAAQLLAHFLPEAFAPPPPPPPPRAQPAQTRAFGGQQFGGQLQGAQGAAGSGAVAAGPPPPPAWVERLLDWLDAVMARGEALPAAVDDVGGASAGAQRSGQAEQERHAGGTTKRKGAKAAAAAAAPPPPSHRQEALPTEVLGAALESVRRILPLLPPPRRRAALAAAWALWGRSAVRSAARARVLAFLSRLVADPAASLYAPLPPSGEPLVLQEEEAAWVAALPRHLWELGAGAPAAAAPAALRLLLDAARHAPAAGPLAQALEALQPQLAPLFCVPTPPQAQAAASAAALRLGPLAAAPLATQRLAVDVLCHLPGPPHPVLLKTAAALCLGGDYPVEVALRLVDVVERGAGGADPGAYWGLLLTLVAGTSSAGVERRGRGPAAGGGGERGGGGGAGDSWRRHVAVVGAACRAAARHAGAPAAALEALAPPLLGVCAGAVSGGGRSRPLYGLLQLTLRALEAPGGGGGGGGGGALPQTLRAALPQAMLDLVVECGSQQEGGSGMMMRAEEAAGLGAVVVAAEAALLGPALAAAAAAAAAAAVGSGEALDGALHLTLALAREPRLAEAWVREGAAARAALGAVQAAAAAAAADGAGGAQVAAAAQLAVLLGTLLGQDLSDAA
jgi:hypothetical protein